MRLAHGAGAHHDGECIQKVPMLTLTTATTKTLIEEYLIIHAINVRYFNAFSLQMSLFQYPCCPPTNPMSNNKYLMQKSL